MNAWPWLPCLLLLVGCTQSPVPPTTPAATESMTNMAHGDKKININGAILSELDKLEAALALPGLSQQIQANRPYGSPEELVLKKVLTQAQFDRIKDRVTIAAVVLTGEAKDIDYLTKLALMQGHLLVAKELIDLKQTAAAIPHFGHPIEEIYVDLEEQLAERQVPEFKTALIRLQDLVKSAPTDARIAPTLSTVTASLDQAIQALPSTQRQDQGFVMQVIDGLLETAGAEYQAAIANGKISAAIEYQDSRGFVQVAQKLYQEIAPQVQKKDPQLHKDLEAQLTKLSTAWPTVLPPAQLVLSSDQVLAQIKALKQTAQKLS